MAKSATGRMVRDRQEAGELLGRWEDSGQRMSDWCSERGINWYSLGAYRGRGVLSARDEPQFVELTVAVPPVLLPLLSDLPVNRGKGHLNSLTPWLTET